MSRFAEVQQVGVVGVLADLEPARLFFGAHRRELLTERRDTHNLVVRVCVRRKEVDVGSGDPAVAWIEADLAQVETRQFAAVALGRSDDPSDLCLLLGREVSVDLFGRARGPAGQGQQEKHHGTLQGSGG